MTELDTVSHYKYCKTVSMYCYSNQFRLPNKPQVDFNNNEIAFKPAVRFLGIYITENLHWNFHVHLLCSGSSRVSYIMKSLKAVWSPYILQNIYFAYFQLCLR